MRRFSLLFTLFFIGFISVNYGQHQSTEEYFELIACGKSNSKFTSPKLELKKPIPTPFISMTLIMKDEKFTGKLYYRTKKKLLWSSWELYRDFSTHNRDHEHNFTGKYLEEDIKYVQFQSDQAVKQPILIHNFYPGHSGESTSLSVQKTASCNCPQPSFCNRSCWCPSGNCPKGSPSNTAVTHLIVHHSAGPNFSSNWDAVVRSFWNDHVNINGWDDIGYNWLIDPNGVVYEGRGEGVSGAHMCANNANKMGVCLIGDFTNQTPTTAAYDKLKELLAWNSCLDNIDPLTGSATSSHSGWMNHISGHKDGCSPGYTVCPGNSFYPQIAALRTDVNSLMNQQGCSTGPPQNCTPQNDNCSNATTLNVTTNCSPQQFTVECATQSYNPNTCDGVTSTQAEDVFFVFTAPSSGQVDIEVDPSSGLDLVLLVNSSCSGQLVGCSDNGGGEGSPESVSLNNLTPNQQYYIRVYDFTLNNLPPTTYTFDICVTSQTIPPPTCQIPTTPTYTFLNYQANGDTRYEFVWTSYTGDGTIYYEYNGTWYDSYASNGDDNITLPCGTLVTAYVTDDCPNNVESDPSQSVTFTTEPCQPSCNGMNVSTSGTNEVCGDGSGSASATVSGGQGPYNYSWSNGGNLSSINGLSAGPYTVVVTDANGCSEQSNITIGDDGVNITGGLQTTDVVCGSLGSASVNPSGGQQPYLVEWSNGTIGSSVNGLSAGAYTVQITDNDGCSTVIQFTISSQGATILLNVQSTGVTCNQLGQAEVFASGGQPPFSAVWSNGSNGMMVNGLAVGNYTVTVSDSNGCSEVESVNIAEDFPPLAAVTVESPSMCAPGSGEALISASGGDGNYSYVWSNGVTTPQNLGLSPGSYTVSVNDGSGCSSTASVLIADQHLVISCFVPQDATCNSSDGAALVKVTGGAIPYSYLWSTGSSAIEATGLFAGNYVVTVTDAEGCTITGDVFINFDVPSFSTYTTDVSCAGEEDGRAEIYPVGGTPPFTFIWSSSHTGGYVIDLAAGNYNVSISDANGCNTVLPIVIGSPLPLTSTLSMTSTQCGIEVLSVGGTTPYIYEWNNGMTTDTISPIEGDSLYFVTITDANSCSSVDSIQTPPNAGLPIAEFSYIIGNGELELYGNPTATGHNWEVNQVWMTPIINPTFPADTSDIIIVQYTSENSCGTTSILDTIFIPGPLSSIDDPVLASEISVYPNPFSDNLSINFGNLSGKFKVRLFNVLGQVITEEELTARHDANLLINKDIPAGTYILHIVDLQSKNQYLKKLIKQ